MSGILGALAPVFLVILLGYGFRQGRIVADSFWEPAERVTFFVFFPALLVTSTATARLSGPEALPMVTGLAAGILAIVALTFVMRRPLGLDGPAFTSLMQGAVRPNVYVGLAASAALLGREGLALGSLCVAVAVPLVNLVSVVAMLRYGAAGPVPFGWRSLTLPVLRNPLILACGLGLLLNVLGAGLPPLIGTTLDILGKASLPIGLLAVGAGLRFRSIGAAAPAVTAASTLKLLALPALTAAICRLLGAGDDGVLVATLYASLPVSATAYVMARQMGGNAPLLAAVITATTAAAPLTMPLILVALGP